jgi:hypothetical protein
MARIEDVDDAELDRALRFIRDHTSPLFLDGELVGSGTFIAWDDQFGILTAHHVPQNPLDSARRFDFTSSQKLGFSLVEHAHRFEREMYHFRLVDVATPVDPRDPGRGPDLAVIHLGHKGLAEGIAARKLFYKISDRPEERLTSSLRDDGIFVVCGAAKEEEREGEPELGFSQVTVESLATYYGGLVRPDSQRFQRDGYGYVDMAVRYPGVDNPPRSFGGVSGGGLWRIPVEPGPDDPTRYIVDGDPVLAGLVFYQGVVDEHRGFLRCHAGDGVYRRVFAAVRLSD